MNSVIDLTAYLPEVCPEEMPRRAAKTVRQIADAAVGVVEGLVTVAIGLSFAVGVLLFIWLLI